MSEDNLYKAEFKQTPGCAFKKNIKTLKLRQISSMNDSRKKLMILVILLLKNAQSRGDSGSPFNIFIINYVCIQTQLVRSKSKMKQGCHSLKKKKQPSK